MPHFFVPPDAVQNEKFTLAVDESRHLAKVLRKKPGDEINLFDGLGRLYRARIETVGDASVSGRIVSTETQPAVNFTLRLFQGMPKGDKFDWILEKMTELGAAEIVPVNTERSVVHLSEEKIPARLERWKKIVTAAAKQSGRASVPSVRAPMDLNTALALCGKEDLTLIPWEGEKNLSLREVLRSKLSGPIPQTGTLPGGNAKVVNVFIGPEGGFSLDEVARAQKTGAVTVTLGPAILRTETAGLFVASALVYETTQGVTV